MRRLITTVIALACICTFAAGFALAGGDQCSAKGKATMAKAEGCTMTCSSKAAFPSMKISVGDKCVQCPMEAEKLAKETKAKVIFAVGEEKFECREKAMAALACASEDYVKKFTRIACVVDGKVIYCDEEGACSGKAKVIKTGVTGEKGSCEAGAKTVAAKGDGCCKSGAKTTLAKSEGTCSKDGEKTVLAKSADGCCKSGAKTTLAKSEGTCNKDGAKATLAKSEGTCSKTGDKAVMAKSEGSCHKSSDKAVLAKSESGCCKSGAKTTLAKSESGCSKSGEKAVMAKAADGCCKSGDKTKLASAGEACCKTSKNTKFLVVGQTFDKYEDAVKARDAAVVAIKKVSMKYIVDGKPVDCESMVCPTAKAAGKVQFVVNEDKTPCEDHARYMVAKARYEAAAATVNGKKMAKL